MPDYIHFKLTHNGATRRFVFSQSNDEFLLLAMRLKALSITGPLSEHERFVWRDAYTIEHPLETTDDLTKAIKEAKFFNERYETTSNMPICIHLEVVKSATATKIENEAAAEEEAAILSLLETGETVDSEELNVDVVLPDAQQSLLMAYHEQLKKQLVEYREQQRKEVADYEESLRQNKEEYEEQQRKELADYEQLLLRNFNENQRRWKSLQAVQTSNRLSTHGNAYSHLERLLGQRQDLIERQRELMAAHLATFPPLRKEQEKKQKGFLRDTINNLQKAFDNYKVQLIQESEAKKKAIGWHSRRSAVYVGRVVGRKTPCLTRNIVRRY